MRGRFGSLSKSSAPRDGKITIGLLLLPGFTLLSYSALIDVLQTARESDRGEPSSLSWAVIGGSKPVRSVCGVEAPASVMISQAPCFDYVIVIGGRAASPLPERSSMIECLRRADLGGATLGGVGSGMFLLIEAGLFDGRRCATDWYVQDDYRLRFASVRTCPGEELVVDNRRISCGGGVAAFDLGHWLLRRLRCQASPAVAVAARLFDLASPRPEGRLSEEPVGGDARVRRALGIIERNLDAPLRAESIAASVGLSKRQLERLFHAEIGTGIQQYSRDLRTGYGLWLLLRTSRSITDVALACGFSDSSHFNRTIHGAFGVTPTEARRDGRPSLESLSKRWLQLFKRRGNEVDVSAVASIRIETTHLPRTAGRSPLRASAGR